MEKTFYDKLPNKIKFKNGNGKTFVLKKKSLPTPAPKKIYYKRAIT
jgi:hypothetical protein